MLHPDSYRSHPTYQLSNMASPDVVCQPCGSALGAPTKECSTAHKNTVPAEGMASRDAPTRITAFVTAANRAAVAPYFACATFVAHRDVTTVRARDVAPRKILVATPHRPPLRRFGGAKMWLKKDLPDGRQVQRIFIPKGFDWVKTISPMLSKAGEGPVMW